MMRRNRLQTLAPLALLVTLAACEAQKSSNPLSPSVAGPIPGVEITAPKLLEPAQGFKFKANQQPIKLTIENSNSSGVRPVTYIFEVASDNAFTTKVFARSGVVAGEGGRTSVMIEALEIGRAYYWRARADDGANSSTYSTADFAVLPQPVLTVPTLHSPNDGWPIDSRRPTLRTVNSHHNDAVGEVSYFFMVAKDQAFTQISATGTAREGNALTEWTVDRELDYALPHFWRVRATDGETTTAWSAVATFTTPGAPKPPSIPPGGGGNCDALVNNKPALVECIHAGIKPTDEFGAFEVTKRVAWALRGEGAGLLLKPGGENIVFWNGNWFAAARICYPDGHIYKLMSDVGRGGSNAPSWQDEGLVEANRYVPAMDPNK